MWCIALRTLDGCPAGVVPRALGLGVDKDELALPLRVVAISVSVVVVACVFNTTYIIVHVTVCARARVYNLC